jgi:hypothetical protein
VSLHFCVVDTLDLADTLEELNSRQEAIEKLTGSTLNSHVRTPESLAHSLSLFFPYRLVFGTIARDRSLFPEVLRIVVGYEAAYHRKALRALLRLLKSVHPDQFVMLGISEIALGFFRIETMGLCRFDLIAHFQFAEQCRALLSDSAAALALSPEYFAPIGDLDSSRRSLPSLPPELREFPLENLCFESDFGSTFPCFRHIALELRKLAVAISPVMMAYVIWNATAWLLGAISKDGLAPGSDEAFQFFVGVLADAKLYALPSIVKVIDGFLIDDLKAGQFTFVISQLKAAMQFIQLQQLRIPPTILLPFPVSGFQQAPPIPFPGFATFAFPLFAESATSAAVAFSGRRADVSLLFPCGADHVPAAIAGNRLLATLPTTQGTLYHLPSHRIASHRLIYLDTVPYDQVVDEITLVSNLMALSEHNARLVKVSALPTMLAAFGRKWCVPIDTARLSVLEVVGEIQAALQQRKLLADDYLIQGRIDGATIGAISKLVGAEHALRLGPKIKAYICT